MIKVPNMINRMIFTCILYYEWSFIHFGKKLIKIIDEGTWFIYDIFIYTVQMLLAIV